MAKNMAKKLVSELLQLAGVTINGNQPWDIQIHNEQTFEKGLYEGTLGLGEAYMEHWWDVPSLDMFIDRVVSAGLDYQLKMNKRLLLKLALSKFFNFQTKRRSLEVGKRHYDLGNELFKNMLDSRMNYSCGYWRNADNLEEAQKAKLELACQKLQLKSGMRVIDIGCGWGSFAQYAAENYGVEVVGITISKEQYTYAKERYQGLPITFRFQDYRDVNETFDRIISIGMFEHVGYLNYREYMKVVHRCLANDGLFLLHTIGSNTSLVMGDDWINHYIFPNSMLPSAIQITQAVEGTLIIEDWHNFGADYDKTLMAWHDRFNQNWDQLKDHYGESFRRMWNYYLLTCAGSFRARSMQLWQIVLSKTGVKGGYLAPLL